MRFTLFRLHNSRILFLFIAHFMYLCAEIKLKHKLFSLLAVSLTEQIKIHKTWVITY